MISFIVIGRNEGWKLDLCLKSIHKTIKENQYIKSEIIYIDSNSSDNSIEIAKQNGPIKIFRLTKTYSPPIARNLGANQSDGNILFFIDGDMEIESSFLKHVINQNEELCYDFINGFYIDYFYNKGWELLYTKQNPVPERINHDYFEHITGGLFMINRGLWEKVGGMKNYMTRGADPDLALRIAKLGYSKLRKNKLMARHHTIKGKHAANFSGLLNRDHLTGRILLYRENIFSFVTLRRLIRHEYMMLVLLTTVGISFVNNLMLVVSGCIYLAGITLRTYMRFRHLKALPAMICKDIIFILGFIFYWPPRVISEVEFESIC